jgi:Phytanoyl-CoA dioxygenase (PhyH)
MSAIANPTVYAGPTPDAVAHYRTHGWVLIATLTPLQADELADWVTEVSEWPDDGDGWMHHYEQTDLGPAKCRTENFTPFHDGLRELLTSGAMVDTAGALLGEPAVLYKEKINYKGPGGAGFAPHQDAPAYRFVEVHVSAMMAVDDATPDNGCLEVVTGAHQAVLPMDDRGCIRSDVVDGFDWVTVPVPAGMTLWFDSRTPHRSGPNMTSTARRALYPTYNAAREGDLRDAYYAQKHAEWEAAGGDPDSVTVSLIGDFQGRPVTK